MNAILEIEQEGGEKVLFEARDIIYFVPPFKLNEWVSSTRAMELLFQVRPTNPTPAAREIFEFWVAYTNSLLAQYPNCKFRVIEEGTGLKEKVAGAKFTPLADVIRVMEVIQSDHTTIIEFLVAVMTTTMEKKSSVDAGLQHGKRIAVLFSQLNPKRLNEIVECFEKACDIIYQAAEVPKAVN